MSTGLMMMLKSLGLDPKMMENVAQAVQSAARDLHEIKTNQQMLVRQNEEILARLRALTPEMEIKLPEVPQLALVNNGR
jgi:hypothetical protein